MTIPNSNIQEKTGDNSVCIYIDGILHKHNIVSLHQRLQYLLSQKSDKYSNISLDLAKVTQMDTAAVAVLVEAKRTAMQHKNVFAIHQASTAVRDALDLAHLTEAFDITS